MISTKFYWNFSCLKFIIIALLIWSPLFMAAQQFINVPQDYSTIQAALNAAEEGTTINVSAGTYFENLVWPEVEGIKLISVDGAENTIIDGNHEGRVIKTGYGFNTSLILDGFTIQNGLIYNEYGAGLYIHDYEGTLKNLVIQDNRIIGVSDKLSNGGGGAYLYRFDGKIEKCVFRNNSIHSKGSSRGGGLELNIKGCVELDQCHFLNNEISSETEYALGGGLNARSAFPVNLKVNNCTFSDNIARVDSPIRSSNGAGIHIYDFQMSVNIDSTSFTGNTTGSKGRSMGGGMYSYVGSLNIFNSSFSDNSSTEGGSAIYLPRPNPQVHYANIRDTRFTQNNDLDSGVGSTIRCAAQNVLNLWNCIISNNTTSGTLHTTEGVLDPSKIEIINSTIAYNDGPIILNHCSFKSSNSIFWNEAIKEIDEANTDNNDVDLKNCIIKNGFVGQNIYPIDPLFISEDILIPQDISPCHSTGNLESYTDTDIDGVSRPFPLHSNPDIGAYEVNGKHSFIRIKFYYDLNQDGVKDSEEKYIANGSVNIQNEVYNNFSSNGLGLTLEKDSYTISYNDDSAYGWYSTSSSDFQFTIDTDNFFQEFEFGIYPDKLTTEALIFIEGTPFRCGEQIEMTANIKNLGTSLISGTLWLELDERIDNFSFDAPFDITSSNHRYGWFFDDLYPLEKFTIRYTVRAPLIESADQIGDIYSFKTQLVDSGIRNSMCYDTELRCSFDPNDKLVSPNREDELALLDDHLFYTIRFQNTGNDYARNVVVRDTLDSNLDLRTFSIASTSHPDKLNVIIGEDHTIAFEFLDIYLLDSLTNLEASNGHVSYHIKPLEGLPEETIIQNTAHIYFDFNPAIVTNTTYNILVEEFPTVSNNNIIINPITLFPNPTGQILNFSKSIDSGKIYTVNGALITHIGNSQYIDVSSLNDGIYFIELELNGEIWKEKFTVLK